MADKEATIYIVDLGVSMGERRNGRDQSDLDWALTYLWDKITSTVAAERKTTTVGVIGLRTDGTANEMGDEEGFDHISILQEISQVLLPDLQVLRQKIKLSNTDEGDAMSAIVVAIQMIAKYCKKLKYHRRIVLVTNANGSMDADDSSEISKKITADGIQLSVIGVDFDDAEYGLKEEDKDEIKFKNEGTLRQFVEDCDGVFGTMQQAIDELGVPRLKSTRPVNSYKGQLTLGNPLQYDSAMCIDVERYPRTMIRRPLTASQFVQRSELSNRSASTSATALPETQDSGLLAPGANGLTSVRNARTYQVKDEEAPGGKKDVDREDLAKGYAYGSTAVHISESEFNVTKLETEAGLEIIGFIPWDTYERYMNMSVSCVIIAQKTNNKAIIAMSSLIHALFELESYAVARLVSKDSREPLIVLLAPSILEEYECLLDIQLPFAEDVRSYKFPPLDRVVTVSGKIITEHRNLPTDDLKSAMSDYVDRMDLSDLGKDVDGDPAEYMPLDHTFSPVLHRLDQAVRFRAVHPDQPIPPPYDILTRYSKPPDELVSNTKRQLEKLVEAANVKKVPPKTQSRKRHRADIAPLSGLDIDSLLGPLPHHPKNITPSNPIPSFRQALDTADSPSAIRTAVQELGAIVEKQISDSFGDSLYGRAIEEMSVMREEMIEVEEVGVWNEWLSGLKGRLVRGEVGGERRDLWWEVRRGKLGLVVGQGGVGEEEAKEFMSFK